MMQVRAALVFVFVAAVGCVTSEPVNPFRPDADVLPITVPTGTAGQVTMPETAGAAGVMSIAGTAGATTTGPAGAGGSAGSGSSAGAGGSSGGAGGSLGAPMDAGVSD